MQNSGGAVILMQKEYDDIRFYYPETCCFEEMAELPALDIFDEGVCSFLDKLSDLIRHDKECRNYPDVLTFGFFCRRAHIEQLKKNYSEKNRLGRGLTFHIAPSNVAINFAYSMAAALLAGNPCAVRVSEKDFAQTHMIGRLLREASKETKNQERDIGRYIALFTYGKKREITDHLSKLCAVRVIWGGDQTIGEIRKSPLRPRSSEITFADRYSLCVLGARAVLAEKRMDRLAGDFYNDTYLFDQNACSSPRLIYWIGEADEIKAAKERFWSAVSDFLKDKYQVGPKVAVDKLLTEYKAAAVIPGIKFERKSANLINRMELMELVPEIAGFTCPGGSFFEYGDVNFNALRSVVTEKFQTLSYYGVDKEELISFIKTNGIGGIDRVVPVGHTADFSLIWDGYDLIRTMSRIVDGFGQY